MPTLEEVMEEAQASMQRLIADEAAQAEWAKRYRLQAFLIGDFYEQIADKKIENLRVLHNA